MKRILSNRYIPLLLGIVFVFASLMLLGVPEIASAQADGAAFGLQEVDDSGLNLGRQDLRVTIARIINVFLGLLGIIAVSLLIYGGFIYMTSQGNEEKISQARKIMINSAIGLAIIMSAFAITRFVMNRLSEATGLNDVIAERDARNRDNNCPGIGLCNGGGGNDVDACLAAGGHFVVKSLSPNSEATGMTNTVVRAVFSNPLVVDLIPAEAVVVRRGDDVIPVHQAQVIDNHVIELLFQDNTGACEVGRSENEVSCLSEGEYTIEVTEGLRDAAGRELVVQNDCGDFPRIASFTNNNDAIDNINPAFENGIQIDGELAANHDVQGMILRKGQRYPVTVDITDRQDERGGVSFTSFSVERVDLGPDDAPDTFSYYTGPTVQDGTDDPLAFFYNLNLGRNMPVPSRYTMTMLARDIDGNTQQTQASFILVGDQCQNGIQDEGEVGVDIGGECLGAGACQADWQCASRKCVDGQCVAHPMITDIDPWEGAAGNFVTILGRHFGNQAGTVAFGVDADQNDEIDDGEWINAPFPQDCRADVWNNEWIIVEVPDGFAIGSNTAVRVTQAVAGNQPPFIDTTIDAHGPKPGPNRGLFTITDDLRPGLCAFEKNGVAVEGAFPDDDIVARGKAFGQIAGELVFGGLRSDIAQWNDTNISASVPRLAPGRVGVRVVVGDTQSNGLPFLIGNPDERDLLPLISAIDPAQTTAESLVTIIGDRFGDAEGSVFLAQDAQQAATCGQEGHACIEGNLALPAACGSTWSPDQVIFQVPAQTPAAAYRVVLLTGEGRRSDGEAVLTIIDGAPQPGICRIEPAIGPAPLPADAPPRILTGLNFGDDPTVFFSKRGFDINDIGTWLSSRVHINPNGGPVIAQAGNEQIQTFIPIDRDANGIGPGTSMNQGQGLLKVADGNALSNSVTYTVQDCRESEEEPDGFHCCIEGAEAGQWKENGLACEGEVRDAGYVWRFTSGKIPNIPEVLEQCNDVDWANPEVRNIPIPSPAPWIDRRQGDNACLNASIVVQFSLPMDEATINQNTVRLFTCEDDNGVANCEGDAKQPAAEQLDLEYNAPQTLWIRHGNGPQLAPNTWYRVELANTISSFERIQVLGQEEINQFPLRVTRPCGDGTAYCFEFRTGNGACELAAASVDPHEYTARYLGVIQDPRVQQGVDDLVGLPTFDDPGNPLYFMVWGRGDRTCQPLTVDGLGWEWRAGGPQAVVQAAPDDRHVDSRALVDARENTSPESVPVIAALDENDRFGPKEATSDLTIDLGDPEIVSFWPHCGDSCTNAIIGMRFNRPMNVNTYRDGFKVFRCEDEFCNAIDEANPVALEPVSPSAFENRVRPIVPLEEDTWYLARASAHILSIGGIENLQIIDGKPLVPFSWKFRTKAFDGECQIESARVNPDPFTARNIGQQTTYSVIPFSSPNNCSAFGQELDPWQYGWEWSVADERVAEVTTFEQQGTPPPYCTVACLPGGSDVAFGSYNRAPALCGNGTVDPGEDCDIADPNERPGISCSLSCLRPGSNPPFCGDGNVEPEIGEECDTADPDTQQFCTNTCTWRGSDAQQPEGELAQAWCGSGNVTFGEDCDISISIDDVEERLADDNPDNDLTPNVSALGCTPSCLHTGTALSQQWCSNNIGIDVPGIAAACNAAVSVCGNNTLEDGEECELLFDDQGNVRDDALLVVGSDEPIDIANARAHCSPSCLLQDLCGLDNIPTADQGGVYCEAGEACEPNTCHILGSSVGYDPPQLCGDGNVGTGEFGRCELDAHRNAPAVPLGQIPVQRVTARGQVPPDELEAEGTQSTQIEAQAVALQTINARGEQDAINVRNENIQGNGAYTLQCGYTEFGAPNIFAARDGNMALPGTENWLRIPFGQDLALNAVELEKVQVDAIPVLAGFGEGNRVLRIAINADDAGIAQRQIPVLPGRQYRLSFSYFLEQGIFRLNGVFLNAEGEALRFLPENLLFDQKDEVIQAEVDIAVPFGQEGEYILAFTAGDGTRLYLDNVVLQEVREERLDNRHNDCPLNADNSHGVASNSCCYPRPARVENYPSPNPHNEEICLNTAIRITYADDVAIDPDTVSGNVVLAEGYPRGFDCAAAGLSDVTEEVSGIIAFADSPDAGFFRGLWQSVKQFFARLFGTTVFAHHDDVAVWCTSSVIAQPNITFEEDLNSDMVTSTISLALTDTLRPNTSYAVVVIGGQTGVQNELGVGIRSKFLSANGQYSNTDFFTFATGNAVCRISDVSVVPDAQLFTEPGQDHPFNIVIESTNNQQIQPVPGVYDWQWSWGPQDNLLYNIPAVGNNVDRDDIDIGARDIEGTLAAVGQARITQDITGQDNGRLFSGFSELTSLFCANPWPARGAFPFEDHQYNFSMSYCADAGRADTQDDDLPYLNNPPIITAVAGDQQRLFGDIDANGQLNEADFECYRDVFNEGFGINPQPCVAIPLRDADLDCRDGIGVLDLDAIGQRIQTGAYPEGIDADGNNIPDCRPENDIRNNFIVREDTLLQQIFFNDTNDDVVGLQIFANPERRTARAWVANAFEGVNIATMQDIVIDGYRALTDGNTYYIDAFNEVEDDRGNRQIFNNIYVLSINSDAQAETRRVFDKLVESFTLNINITNFGYCFSDEIRLGNNDPLPRGAGALASLADPAISCVDDFGCRDPFGNPRTGTNGVCSNARDKFLRDWERLSDLRIVQSSIEAYAAGQPVFEYPELPGGTFIPQYTNSRWPSWDAVLSGAVGNALPDDPLNQWSSCGVCEELDEDGNAISCTSDAQCVNADAGVRCIAQDPQTCWNAADQQYVCPQHMSVFEYNALGSQNYQIHASLEYFNPAENVVSGEQGFVDPDHFTADPWCEFVPGEGGIHSPFAGRCGDGVVNEGEQCDPPGAIVQRELGFGEINQAGQCELQDIACVNNADCGFKTTIQSRGREVQLRSEERGVCIVREKGLGEDLDTVFFFHGDEARQGDFHGIACSAIADCSNELLFGDVDDIVGISMDTGRSVFRGDTRELFNSDFYDETKYTVGCHQKKFFAEECVGAIQGEQGAAIDCRAALGEGSFAPWQCNNQCQWDVGQCQASGVACGNGQIEAGELCDDGQFNGQYGHCAGPQSYFADANNNRVYDDGEAAEEERACLARHPMSCGNGTLDYADQNVNGRFDPGETAFEFCDQVEGVCQFIREDVGRLGPNLYILLDRSGSMDDPAPSGRTRWQEAVGGIAQLAQRFDRLERDHGAEINMSISVFSNPDENPVFRNGSEGCPDEDTDTGIKELVSIAHSDTDEFRFSDAFGGADAPTPNGGTPTARALRNMTDDILRIEGDLQHNVRSKRLILVTDGEPSCQDTSEDVERELERLRDDAGIETFIVGFGFDNQNLNDWAQAGGTAREGDTKYYQADSAQELVGAVNLMLGCESYSHAEGNTCAVDCQDFGGFCGDGIVQAGTDERCDDGNKIDNDACNNECQIREVPVEEQNIIGRCGDGEVQSPNADGVAERCDLGDQNGIACDPTYGESCRYCAFDCREVITVDATNFCGNGRIDKIAEGEGGANIFEACDVTAEGAVIAPNQAGRNLINLDNREDTYLLSNFTSVQQCPDIGQYTCNNDCRALSSEGCVDCGLTQGQAGPIPTVRLINPLTDIPYDDSGDGPRNDQWGEDAGNRYLFRFDPWEFYRRNGVMRYDQKIPLMSPQDINGGVRINADLQCNGVYKFSLNAGEIAERLGLDNNFDNDRDSGLVMSRVSLADTTVELGLETVIAYPQFGPNYYTTAFDYPVNGEIQEVQNEYVISPAVPRGYYRIVVRWDGSGDDGDTVFVGNVYNNAFDRNAAPSGRLSFMDLGWRRCSSMTKMPDDGSELANYWWADRNEDMNNNGRPDCSTYGNNVFMHEITNSQKTYVQATTLNGRAPRNSQDYAFFVSAVSNGAEDTMNGFEGHNVTVEVYKYRPNQIPDLSIYKPVQVFHLDRARPSNNRALAKYWHVFNISVNQANGLNSNSISLVDQQTNGVIATDFVDVECNVDNGICRRGE